MAAGSDELELRCSAENAGDRIILAFRYPAIQGIGTLSEYGDSDRLLHSTMMGALFFNPFHLFQGDAADLHARGMVVSHYPNGFHGSALQLMAYYAEGRGGFYIAAKDNLATDKDLNFYKARDNKSLTCEVAHIQWDAAGKEPGSRLSGRYCPADAGNVVRSRRAISSLGNATAPGANVEPSAGESLRGTLVVGSWRRSAA